MGGRGGRGGLHHTGRNTGLGGLGRTGGLADTADYGILDGADWWTGGRGGLRNPGQGGLADWGGQANGAEGGLWVELGRRKGRTGKPGAGVPADWADKSGCAHPGRLASLRLKSRGDFRSAKSGCGLWGHLAPYIGNPHQILRCSCRRHLLGDSHFEGAKSLYR